MTFSDSTVSHSCNCQLIHFKYLFIQKKDFCEKINNLDIMLPSCLF